MRKIVIASCLTFALVRVEAADSVALYGVVDLSVAVERNGAGRVVKAESGVMNGSRLGFRGAEDLGAGYTTMFTLEMGINADSGSLGQGGLAFGRQVFVGLKGGFGAVLLGRQYSPIYFSELSIDPFVGGTLGDMTVSRGWFNAGNVRVNNAVTYQTPKLAGLQVTTLYGFGEVAGSTRANSQLGLSADYLSGPLTVSAAYHSTRSASGTDTQRTAFGGAAYDFGVVKLHAAADHVDGFNGAKVRDYMLGFSAPLGTGRLMASVIKKDNRALSDADAHQVSLGYRYDISKRTALYTSYAQVRNARNSSVAAGGVSGHSDKAFDVGIRHFF
jgi:predicted porin